MQRNPISLVNLFFCFLHIVSYSQPSPGTQSFVERESMMNYPGNPGQSHIDIENYFRILDRNSPLDIQLNDEVRQQIDHYLKYHRTDLELSLQRSRLYFPLIEQMLDKYDLPLELKYLTVIESCLNPLAKSPSGAVGLWQFLYTTCSLFDLQVDSYIDERRDPYKSTEAACKYLTYLYRTYQDWNLVMAGFNGGPGEVRKAFERSGGKTDYWEIRPYLSEQSKNYVPAFMAVIYLMSYPQLYGLKSLSPEIRFEDTDTLMISYAISFQQITASINITSADLEYLNPLYKRRFIPDRTTPCTLVLPKELVLVYLDNEKKIVSTNFPEADYRMLLTNAGSTDNLVRVVHTVKRGEYCHKIALNYNCTIENIKAWNNLTTMDIYPGQTLNIWVKNQVE
jgi:membrane-bound lytic murein transglycosylase D